MMSRSFQIVVILILLSLSSCNDAPNISISDQPCADCDTCYNTLLPPPGPWYQDGQTLPARQRTYRGKVSGDGLYIAYLGGNSDYKHDHRSTPTSGLIIQEIASHEIIYFVEGIYSFFEWNPTSNVLYYIREGILCEFSLSGKDLATYPDLGHFDRIAASPSGSMLFMNGYRERNGAYGIWRWDLGNEAPELVTANEIFQKNFFVASDTVLCSLCVGEGASAEGLYYLNIPTGLLRRDEVDGLSEMFGSSLFSPHLSPDGKRLIFDAIVKDRMINNGYMGAGVWILNRETSDLVQILEKHPTYNYIYRNPKWSSNSTFVADWLCANDSSILIYEYTISGRPIKRLTSRDKRFWE